MTLRNLARSGGPRTAAGRALTARNALKTGAYTAQVVLPWEDAPAFEALAARLGQDFEPVGAAELAIVNDVAVLIWKKLRIDRVEHAVMAQMAMLPLTAESIGNSFGPDFNPRAMHRLVPSNPVTQQEFDDASALLAQLQEVLDTPDSQTKRLSLRRKWPAVHQALSGWVEDYALEVGQFLAGQNLPPGTLTLERALLEIQESYQPLIWLWQNRARLATALRQAQDSRLLTYMKTENTQRAQADTSRAFYRTLAELRRQQEWRIRRTAIPVDDVTPK